MAETGAVQELLYIKQSSSVLTVETRSNHVLYTITTASRPLRSPVVTIVRGIASDNVVAEIKGNEVIVKSKATRAESLVFASVLWGPRDCFRNVEDNKIYIIRKPDATKPGLDLTVKEDRTKLATWRDAAWTASVLPGTKKIHQHVDFFPPALAPGPYRLLDPGTDKPTTLLDQTIVAYEVYKKMKKGGMQAQGTAPGGAGAMGVMAG